MKFDRIRSMDAGSVLRALMCAFTAACLIAGLLAPDLRQMLSGFGRICVAPAQLTRDYFKPGLGSVSGAMLNYFLVGAAFCAMMFLPEAKVNGGTVLGFFLTMGFCSFGLNLLNIIPLVFGAFVYSRIRRQPFGRFINFAMLSTAIAPLITQLLFYYPVNNPTPVVTAHGIALAVLVGVIFGCALPALCAHAALFHKGYNLYNAGPAAGFLCFLLYAVLYETLGVEAPAIAADLGEGHRAFVNAFCGAVFAMCLACGLAINGGFRGYGTLVADSGHKADFTAKYTPGTCVINMGVYGLFILLVYNLIGAKFTGATMGAVFCMVCCGCSGATPLNVLPIVIGYVVASLFGTSAINAQGIVVGLCFASGLAPIAGEYGVLAGIVAGILHYCLVTSVPAIHGGFNLYNGGFTAGIVCFVYVPVLEHFFRTKARRKLAGA